MDPSGVIALRDRMLDAAEAVVVRQGIANLTLDAVAAEAKMSKGGLLHYFPTKDRLVEALVTRCAEHWRAGSLEAYESATPGPGRMARALLGHLADTRAWTEQCMQSSSAAFAALAQNPRLIEPMRAVYSELRRRVSEDGLAPGVGETILVAMDGLWLNRVLGLAPVDQQRMDRIRRALETLITPARRSRTTARRDPHASRGAPDETGLDSCSDGRCRVADRRGRHGGHEAAPAQGRAARGWGGGRPAFEPAEATQVVGAREVSWQPTADLVGTVFPIRSVTVRNEIPGVVRVVGFKSGDEVQEGQVLLKQDDTTEQADLAAAKAMVRVAEANIEQAQAQIKLAEAELERLASVQSRAVAAVDIDRARTKLDTVKADRGRWSAEADQARAKVAQVEARLAKLTFKAPFHARAGMRNIHEGQYLAEGADVVMLQELTDTTYLDFAIPQEYAPRVVIGTTVMATAELLGTEPIKITVVAVDATVNYDTRNLRVRAIVDNLKGALVPGMSVQVRVPIDAAKTLVAVPTTAVRRAAYGNSLFVIEPGEKPGEARARQRFVTLGQTIGEEVVVLQGLKAGEQIAAAGSFKLHDGSKVMVAPAGGAAAPKTTAGGS